MLRGRVAYFVALAGLTLFWVQAAALAADRRVALVIGNSAYRNAPMLTNPTRDAQSVAEMFKAAGFDSVELRKDLDSLELKRAIRGFMLTARDADVAVVFFAGHGIEVNGANYVIPIDAKLKTDFDAEDEGVALERIIRAVEPARRLRLIMLDACRDNPFINLMQRTVGLRAITAGLGKVEPEISDTLVAYAARAGSFAEDGQSEHSPFTTALLKHLPTPGLDIRVAFGRVRDDVLRATGGKQEPFVYGSLGGSTISIVREEVKPELPAKDSYAETRRDYEFAERVATKDGWTYFLQAHPTGFFADLARAQLTKFPSSTPTTTVARIDVSKPEARRATLESPAAVPAPPVPTTPAAIQPRRPEPVLERAAQPPVPDRNPCERDRETLARLRNEQVFADIVRFSHELKCEALRPQLTRLMESTGPSGDVAALSTPPRASSPLKPSAPPPSRPEAPLEPAAVSGEGLPSSCEKEGQALARLRLSPDLRALDRFAKDMTCKDLKPQVMRLRESLQED